MKLPVWVTVFVSGIVDGWIGGVVTATLISNADEGSRGGSRLHLYGGQSYLDQYRKGDQG